MSGELSLVRFEKFLRILSEKELERFDDIYSDAKWLEGKTARKNSKGSHTVKPTPGPANVYEMLEGSPEPTNLGNTATSSSDKSALQRLINSADEFLQSDEEIGKFMHKIDF